MAKLQNPVKHSFDNINDSLKETHSGLNKYTKSLDKVCRGICSSCLLSILSSLDLTSFFSFLATAFQRQAPP